MLIFKLSPFIAWHDAFHELIEHGNFKCGVTMIGAPHHAFCDERATCQPQDFGIPAIVVHELYYGAYKGQRTAENLARVAGLQFEVLDFDAEDARAAGELRAQLAVASTPIGPYDVLIAEQALARTLTLVTHNTSEFQRVLGLRIEEWE